MGHVGGGVGWSCRGGVAVGWLMQGVGCVHAGVGWGWVM